ncbi:MAG TPA: hypothetical protein VIG42_02610 [Solirubrobacteraceae bacterium]|jgi:hypothetical protein
MTDIRSYRAVFDLERRIYRVDRLRLNPSGIPLRGVVYFLAILTCVAVLARLPLVGLPMRLLPWYLREVAAPGAAAALLTLVKIDGRPAHLAALALLRYGLGPRELVGFTPRPPADRPWRPNELILLADGSDARLRRLRYTGPGAVRVRVAHVRANRPLGRLSRLARTPSVTLAPLPGMRAPRRGQVIALAAGARLEVKSRT